MHITNDGWLMETSDPLDTDQAEGESTHIVAGTWNPHIQLPIKQRPRTPARRRDQTARRKNRWTKR